MGSYYSCECYEGHSRKSSEMNVDIQDRYLIEKLEAKNKTNTDFDIPEYRVSRVSQVEYAQYFDKVKKHIGYVFGDYIYVYPTDRYYRIV